MVFDVMRMIMLLVMSTLNRGVARIFQRGGHRQGHHPGIADYIEGLNGVVAFTVIG